MKTLIIISLLFSFGATANVGESETNCLKNQSTQARGNKAPADTGIKTEEKQGKNEKQG